MADIVTLSGKYKSISELQSFSDAQYLALKGAADKIKTLQEEIIHLQDLLSSTTPLIEDNSTLSIPKTPELQLIETQISLIHNRFMKSGNEMTLEEAKILDTLVKNKQILLGKFDIEIPKNKKKQKELTDAELILIASTPEKK